MCSVTGATRTPPETSRVSNSAVIGRPALAISALPGSTAYTFWYAESGRELHMSGYPSKVRELSWDFTGRFLATGGGDVICVWDCGGSKGPEGTTPKMLEGHGATVSAVAWQRRGFLLASGDGCDGIVKRPEEGVFVVNLYPDEIADELDALP